MALKVDVLIIDPQADFVNPNGSLFVPGADKDMERLAGMVHRIKDKLNDIHITLDSHHKVDISHPIWWKSSSGKHPDPFTMITADDVSTGKWTTTMPGMFKRSLAYLRALETNKRYPHVIWPYHCLIGSEGATVHPGLFQAVQEWEDNFAAVDFITKGSNSFTEHFSAVKAEVPDPEDVSTQINIGFIQTLEKADIILVAGEARSHCLAHTVKDIVSHFSDPKYVEKLYLITDASSDVPGFNKAGDDFLNEMLAKGMKTTTTKDFLA